MKKIDDILKQDLKDISKMNIDELRNDVKRMANISKARIEKMNNENIYSQAVNKMQKRDNNYEKIDSMNINQLRNEYKREYQFLKSKTSTVTGARKIINKMEKNIPQYSSFTQKEREKFWKLYGEFNERNAGLVKSVGSKETLGYLAKVTAEPHTKKTIMKNLELLVREQYEKNQESDNIDDDVSISKYF